METVKVLVGGPLLGERDPIDAPQSVLKPLITPPIQLGASKQKLILLPKLKYISVLAYQTGKTLGNLVPFAADDDAADEQEETSLIESVALTSVPMAPKQQSVQDVLGSMDTDSENDGMDEGDDQPTKQLDSHRHLLLVGCRDGSIREFVLNQLDEKFESASISTSNVGSYILDRPCLGPHRIIRATPKQAIMHLTVPGLPQSKNLMVYALVETKPLHERKKGQLRVNVSLLRLNIPLADDEDSTKDLELNGTEQKDPIDSLSCRVGRSQWSNTVPFAVQSVVKPLSGTKDGQAIFCIVARTSSIHVYYTQLGGGGASNKSTFPPISLTISKSNALTACAVSTNKEDICCGHETGEIKVMKNILSIIEEYHVATVRYNRDFGEDSKGVDRPDHPSKSVVSAKLHWHAHPVASLAFDGDTASLKDPLFYSGSLESVMCTWQVSQGNFKPTDVLPRLALGGIVHIVTSAKGDGDAPSGILVFAQDNSLQLLESHNKSRLWKIQGVAVSPASTKESNRSILDAAIEVDPRAKGSLDGHIILSGLPDAPGFMHWYSPTEGRVTASLEVAPYNRVSRTYREESPMPAPRISDHGFSKNGDDLITVDEVATENVHVGAVDKTSKHGIVSTIRFWTFSDESTSDSKIPYQLSAAMTHPHGPKNRISALAVAQNGSCACTLSSDEGAFRVWFKSAVIPEDGTSSAAAWSCRYKVTIPAAFTNCDARKGAATFSSDASLLAIAFGSSISIWDVDEGRFLTSLEHWSGDAVDSCSFVNSQGTDDLLLTKSAKACTLQSPFGEKAAFKGWSWGIPEGVKDVLLTDAQLVSSDGFIAAALYFGSTNKTKIVMIDATSGLVRSSSDYTELDNVEGCITTLGSNTNHVKTSRWDNVSDGAKPVLFYGISLTGEILQFRSKSNMEPSSLVLSDWSSMPLGDAPKLEVASSKTGQKRPRVEAVKNTEGLKKALAVFGNVVEADSTMAPPASSELPSLSGNFVHAFVGRSLSRRKKYE